MFILQFAMPTWWASDYNALYNGTKATISIDCITNAEVLCLSDTDRERGIATRLAKDLVGKEKQFLPFPLQATFMSSLRKAALEQRKWDLLLFWGGQIAPVLRHTKAPELMQSLIEETTTILKRL